MNYLQQRMHQPEHMDEPALDEQSLYQAVSELDRLNRISFTARQLSYPILKLARRHRTNSLSVLELACGSGEVLQELTRICQSEGLYLSGLGMDINQRLISLAKQSVASDIKYCELRYQTADVLSYQLPKGYDIIFSTLFFHHLTEGQVKQLLGKLSQLKPKLLLINDLKRSRLGLVIAIAATRMLCHSRITQQDGKISVEGAFTPAEFCSLAEQAGLFLGQVKYQFPERFLYSWSFSKSNDRYFACSHATASLEIENNPIHLGQGAYAAVAKTS